MSMTRSLSVIIIGAGVTGLGAAWRLAQAGARVTVFDKAMAGSGATHAAAGMLAACAEAEPGEEDLIRLCRASQAMWPGFAEELKAASGIDVELRTEGTLIAAMTADDRAKLQHHLSFQQKMGLPVEWLNGAETRRREPQLSPHAMGAIWSPEDHQVENRLLAQALRLAAERSGAHIRESTPVSSVMTQDGEVIGVHLHDGTDCFADCVVLAAGPWSRKIEGIPADMRPPVRPIKGQMLALQMDPAAPLLRHIIWGQGIYLVPRLDGRLVIGATVEEKGFDASITAGGMLALLEGAWRLVPSIEELPLVETWVGHRPGSRDDAPIFGASPMPGLIYATGHHRNGILLAPMTAEVVRGLALDHTVDPLIAAFGYERFAPRAAEQPLQ